MQLPARWSPHIAGSELVAPGREQLITDERGRSLYLLAADLENIREAACNKPIRITSGLRPVIGTGAGARSQHVEGQAADIQIDGLTPLELQALIYRQRARLHVRQVIAETRAGLADLSQPMVKGGGRWVHVAILGPGFSPTSSAWLTSADGSTYHRWSP